jgi:hypothetical protein
MCAVVELMINPERQAVGVLYLGQHTELGCLLPIRVAVTHQDLSICTCPCVQPAGHGNHLLLIDLPHIIHHPPDHSLSLPRRHHHHV